MSGKEEKTQGERGREEPLLWAAAARRKERMAFQCRERRKGEDEREGERKVWANCRIRLRRRRGGGPFYPIRLPPIPFFFFFFTRRRRRCRERKRREESAVYF